MGATLRDALAGLPAPAPLHPWPRGALGRALWVPDGPACLVCGAGFGRGVRRHHCRRCGLLVCGACARGGGAGRVCAACSRVGGWRALTDEQIYATFRAFRRLVPCPSPALTADLLALAGGAVRRSAPVRDAALADRGDLAGLAARVACEAAAAWARGGAGRGALLEVVEAALGLLGAFLAPEGTPPALAVLLLGKGAFAAAGAALGLRGPGLGRVRGAALALLQLVSARAAPGSEALGAAAGAAGTRGALATGLLALLDDARPGLAGPVCAFLANLVERCPEHAPGLVAAGLAAALPGLAGRVLGPDACALQAARLVAALAGAGVLAGAALEPFAGPARAGLAGAGPEARAAGALLALTVGLPVAPPLPADAAALVDAALRRARAPRRAPAASPGAPAPRPRSGGPGPAVGARAAGQAPGP